MPHEVKAFDYAEFRKALEFFRSENTWLACPECCRGGGGGPPDRASIRCYFIDYVFNSPKGMYCMGSVVW